MKKTITLIALVALIGTSCTNQQMLQTIETAGSVLGGEGAASALTNDEIISGLKEALTVGTDNATGFASAIDGFNNNARIHIPFPEDAIKVKNTVESLGLSPQVDKFVTTLNRAAEEASKDAGPIFLNAILSMSITDGLTILKGDKDAATSYLREKTYESLYSAFAPKVKLAVANVKVGENWTPLANAYNTATFLTGGEPVNPDLNDYVTGMAIDGLFTLLADEEEKIRSNPAARVTDLLKKVFGSVQG